MWTAQKENALRTGTIISFHSNFAIVKDDREDLKTLCTLRGRFKLSKTKPMVGDHVEYMITGDRGRIESIFPRTITLKKPRVTNIDTVVVVVSISSPDVQYSTIDRIIAAVTLSKAEIILVLNKLDITPEGKIKDFRKTYSPYEPLFTSTTTGVGIDELKTKLKGRVSVFAGPSGVGKSSLLNRIFGMNLRTGRISEATNMGRHTTTSASLLELEEDGFVVDTPGFITVDFKDTIPLEVQELFPEIKSASVMCAFDDCIHDAEPGCHVKELVKSGKIPKSRYKSYLEILEEVRKGGLT